MTNQRGVPEALPDPSPDQLRAIARTARNSSGSASDDCGPLAYVLHGWRAAAIAFRAQQPAQVEALSAAQAGVPMRERPEGNTLVWVADPTSSTGVKGFFADSVPCPWWYKAGLVFRREQDAAALARTMLSAAPQPSPSPAPAIKAVRAWSYGGSTGVNDYLMEDGSIKAMRLDEVVWAAGLVLAPAQPGQEGEREYPPLPEPDFKSVATVVSTGDTPSTFCTHNITLHGVSAFSAATMRAYVDADRAARAAPQPATADAVAQAIEALRPISYNSTDDPRGQADKAIALLLAAQREVNP